MKRLSRFLCPILLLALSLSFAACSGDDGSTTGATVPSDTSETIPPSTTLNTTTIFTTAETVPTWTTNIDRSGNPADTVIINNEKYLCVDLTNLVKTAFEGYTAGQSKVIHLYDESWQYLYSNISSYFPMRTDEQISALKAAAAPADFDAILANQSANRSAPVKFRGTLLFMDSVNANTGGMGETLWGSFLHIQLEDDRYVCALYFSYGPPELETDVVYDFYGCYIEDGSFSLYKQQAVEGFYAVVTAGDYIRPVE